MANRLINDDLGFKPHIEGTRIKVQQIAEYHGRFGWDAKKIASSFNLTHEQVDAALAYYHDHKDEIDAAIKASKELVADLTPGVPYGGDSDLMLLMTPQEVAQEYPISVEAVYQAIRRKRLAARQSGKTWLLRRRDAEQLWGHKR
jgi:excisionase family DNA binding protein